jgi:sugar/nucleoside kinase (ribokinase family)
MNPDLVVVGDVMVDVAVSSDALRRGGDVHGEVRLRPGGSAANAAVWAAGASARVRLHGRVGDDLAGRLVTEALRERGVDPAMAVDAANSTGTMLIVTEAGDRSMVAHRGANARLRLDDLPGRIAAGAVLVSGYLLFDPGSEPAAVAALERAQARHAAVDAASWPMIEDYGADAFLTSTAGASMILANALEARALTGLQDPEDAAGALADRYGAAAVKLGSEGALLVMDRDRLRSAAPPISEGDPTGAGDAFDGVLLAALARGVEPAAALRAACAAGARAAASDDNWPER